MNSDIDTMIDEVVRERRESLLRSLTANWGEIADYIRENLHKTDREIAEQFGLTAGQIKYFRLHYLGIRKYPGRPRKDRLPQIK